MNSLGNLWQKDEAVVQKQLPHWDDLAGIK
jgi:hypothetical protein